LAHTVGDETERAYQRGGLLDKRRRLMEMWASFLPDQATAWQHRVDALRRWSGHQLRR
jgi:hypothetical protein